MLLLQRLVDGGGRYAETNLDYWIIEPWNAASSLAFLLPVFYWLYRLRGRYYEYIEIIACLPFLFLGGLGSTLFHAFRTSRLLILMDVLPVLIASLGMSIYFWLLILPRKWWLLGVIVAFFGLQYIFFRVLPPPYSINLAYFVRGVVMFLPMVLMAQKIRRQELSNDLWLAIAFFILALIFRALDKEVTFVMYMGSHWLWHLSTVVGVFYLSEFMYNFLNWKKEQKRQAPHFQTTPS
ncbi:MAG: hypothetical protein MUE85_18610 [Microscillaceae bacterium]|jgi:hypothetical protein|nr:hypothetical protein [Microscillaceae bacterium]